MLQMYHMPRRRNWYQQNQCDLILQQGGPDGIVELADPL